MWLGYLLGLFPFFCHPRGLWPLGFAKMKWRPFWIVPPTMNRFGQDQMLWPHLICISPQCFKPKFRVKWNGMVVQILIPWHVWKWEVLIISAVMMALKVALGLLGVVICKVCLTKFSLVMLCLSYFPFFYNAKASPPAFLQWFWACKGQKLH